MKIITTLILLIINVQVSAQGSPAIVEKPRYKIHIITANENMLKGLLLEVKDTSVIVYPGKLKEWKKDKKYTPVEFGYHNIRELELKRKSGSWKKFSINGSKPLFNEFKTLMK